MCAARAKPRKARGAGAGLPTCGSRGCAARRLRCFALAVCFLLFGGVVRVLRSFACFVVFAFRLFASFACLVFLRLACLFACFLAFPCFLALACFLALGRCLFCGFWLWVPFCSCLWFCACLAACGRFCPFLPPSPVSSCLFLRCLLPFLPLVAPWWPSPLRRFFVWLLSSCLCLFCWWAFVCFSPPSFAPVAPAFVAFGCRAPFWALRHCRFVMILLEQII